MSLFRSLKHPSFALLWGGQALSRLGDSLYRIALAWWVLEKTGSATAMGTVLIFSYAPMVLFLLVGGVAVDRFHRLKLMLASDIVRGTIVLVIALLAATGRLEVWHVYVASALFGAVNAFFQPAYTVIIPEIVPVDALTSANSLTVLSKQLADIVGPAIGAAAIALGSPSFAFALNGLSFFVSAACLAPLMNRHALRGVKKESPGAVRDLREGISAILRSTWLWFTISVAALGNATLNGPVSVAMPFLIKEELHAGVGALGLVYSMIALGAVLATIWLGRSTRVRRRGLTTYGAWVICGLSVLACGLPISLVGIWLAALVCGASITACSLIWTNTLQELVPREVLGRVSSIDLLGSYCLMPVGYGVTGWATDQIGASMVFVIGGAVTVGLAALGLSQREIRQLD
jgi:DHA3 family tetracycline resistance protein-like MFS transporter